MKSKIACLALLVAVGCSPLRSSPNDEKHQLELTLHEVQTNLDDLKHGMSCYQTELQILEGRIKYYENALASLKQNELEKQQGRLDKVSEQLLQFEKKWAVFEKKHQEGSAELQTLSTHAHETTAALTQFKNRIGEIEGEIFSQNHKFDEVAKLKGSIDQIAKGFSTEHKVYRVRPGDSLEKIARFHKTTVEKIKKLNDLEQDLIVAGQQLKIPVD